MVSDGEAGAGGRFGGVRRYEVAMAGWMVKPLTARQKSI